MSQRTPPSAENPRRRLWPPKGWRGLWQPAWFGGVLWLLAALLLLTLLFPEEGTLFGRLASGIRQIGGWAVWLAIPALAAAGARLIRGKAAGSSQPAGERWEPLLIIFVLTFPAIHILAQATFEEAYQGEAAGLLGWALAEPLLIFLGRIVTSLFYLGLMGLAVAMWRGVTLDDLIRSLIYASGRLRHWAEELAQDPDELSARTVVPEEEDTDLAGGDLVAATIRPKAPRPARLPPLDLLERGTHRLLPQAEIDHAVATIEQTLADFGLVGTVTEVRQGPSVTQYGVEPGYINRHDAAGDLVRQQKVRISQIANLRADFALALAVSRLRIEAPVPGRGIVGIEVPNSDQASVRVRDVLDSPAFRTLNAPLGIGLGQDVAGSAVAIDLAKMPHLLIAGTTGSGKSVCIKTIITSLIVNNTPDTLQLVLIDPKRVEMLRFNGLPHLLGPVEVEGERIIGVLRWVVTEMERRYALFATANARNLAAWNRLEGHDPLPRLVVLVDELADLMGQYGAETERTLCRLAQMARATGIHLVVATQRPSTDVITGLIKANFPARISFAVASATDSRVVLDTGGAEQLLGSGDMLFLSPEASVPMRVQGSFVDDAELERLLQFWAKEVPPPETPPDPPWQAMLVRMKVIEDTDDDLEKAIALCQKYDTISASLIQRRLRVGYPRAARIMESLYEMGLVEDPKTGGKTRKSYVSADQDDPLGDWIGQEGQADVAGDGESADSPPA